jgi:hypothetical protein
MKLQQSAGRGGADAGRVGSGVRTVARGRGVAGLLARQLPETPRNHSAAPEPACHAAQKIVPQ